MSSTISAAEANITHAEAIVTDKHGELNFTLDVKDVDHLNKVIKNIEALKGVLEVKRVKTG